MTIAILCLPAFQAKNKPGAGSCPIHLVAYWKYSPFQTDLRLDYKYNSYAMAVPTVIQNISLAVPVDGDVGNMQSQPTGTW